VTHLTTLVMVCGRLSFSCWLILVRPHVLPFLATYCGNAVWWKKAELRHDGGSAFRIWPLYCEVLKNLSNSLRESPVKL